MRTFLLLILTSFTALAQYDYNVPGVVTYLTNAPSGGGTDPGTPTALWAKTDESSGTVVNDSSTAAHNGTVGTAAWVAGPFSNAINVAGTGAKSAQFTTASAYTFAGDLYVSAWVNGTDSSHFNCIWCDSTSGFSGNYALIDVNPSGQAIFSFDGTIEITGSALCNTGSWVNIVLWRVSGVFTLFVNGVSQGTYSNSSTFPASVPLMSFGAKIDSTSPAFYSIADCRVSAQTPVTLNNTWLLSNK